MKQLSSYIITITSVLLQLLMWSCINDAGPAECPASEEATYLRVRLYMSVGTDTRADDGSVTASDEAPEDRLTATEAENHIDDITLFFAPSATTDDIDHDAELKSLYIDFNATAKPNYTITGSLSGAQDYYKEVLIKLDENTQLEDGQWKMMAVANYGNLSSVKSFDDLRERIATKAWTPDDSKVEKTGFVMSSFDPDKGGVWTKVYGNPTYPGSKEKPYLGTCSLMRLAGRIDICTSETTDQGYGVIKTAADGSKYVEFTAYDPKKDPKAADAAVGTVQILAAEQVNSLSKSSYLIRHTSEVATINTLTSSQMPLGLQYDKLLSTVDKLQERYVIDPLFLDKKETTETNKLEEWFGNSRPDYLHENYDNGECFTGNALVEKFIQASESGSGDYGNFDTSLTIGYANENTYLCSLPTDKFATGLCFKTRFIPSKTFSTAAEAESQNADPTAKADNTANVTGGTSTGSNDFWHFAGKDGSHLYFSNAEAADDYKKNHHGSVTYHPDGISYYHIFINHAVMPTAGASESEIPMRHAIVRNNVYRVLLHFTGPGADVPFKTEEPEDVTWTIHTRDWNTRIWNVIQQPEVEF